MSNNTEETNQGFWRLNWHYPTTTPNDGVPPPNLRHGECDELDVRQHDNLARSKVSTLLLKVGLPLGHVSDDVVGETETFEKLAGMLEMEMISVSKEFAAALLSHFHYNVLRGLVRVLWGVDEPEGLMQFLVSGKGEERVDTKREYRRLCYHLSNSDTIHQSLLCSTRDLVADFPSPHVRAQDILPSFPIYDAEGRVHPLFRLRPLTAHEKCHPRADPDNLSSDPRSGRECSIAGNMEQFRRAFAVFSAGLLKNTDLHRDRAIVTGGAITACLMPWPHHIRELYIQERLIKWLIEVRLGFPIEIGEEISQYVPQISEAKERTDEALAQWLTTSNKPYNTSDIDVFFLVPQNATSVVSAADHLVAMHAQIVRNRAAIPPPSYLSLNRYSTHWAFDGDLDDDWDWYAAQIIKMKEGGMTSDEALADWDDPPKLPQEFYDEDERGWSGLRRAGWEGRMRFMQTVRTNNSVTITGAHPARHVQLMMPVTKAAEEVVLAFDMDCNSVFFDGENVYATHRALRSFNTRTNMVDMTSIRDRARAARMEKYTTKRGFSTLFFEKCIHHPRCDVTISQDTKDILCRMFFEKPRKDHDSGSEQDGDDDDEGEGESPDGMDYEPQALVSGYGASPHDVTEDIRRLASEYTPYGNPKQPTVQHLTYEHVTNNPRKFKEIILKTDEEFPGFIPMQFKWVKDTWLRKRIGFGIALEKCYMCGSDVEASEERVSKSLKEFDPDVEETTDEQKEKPSRKIPLCPSCTTLNAQKRSQTYPMNDMTAVVTGGRTKIGYQTALKLLRCGATVIITTRFPLVAASKYRNEPDSSEWWDRLRVYALDLRDLGSVLRFAEVVKDVVGSGGLDILVNNAAQTIWRPAEWYEGLVKEEKRLAHEGDVGLLRVWMQGLALEVDDASGGTSKSSLALVRSSLPVASTAIRSQLSLVGDTMIHHDSGTLLLFPPLLTDAHGDQLDLRTQTTWTCTITQTPPLEIIETNIINALAPTLLIQHLIPILVQRTTATHPRFIVNVTSPEGTFSPHHHHSDTEYRTEGVHPHTNMAKAALNRLTQTIAGEVAKEGVYVTAVDPGWVSLMGVVGGTKWMEGVGKRMKAPLGEEDGAARVLDPVFGGLSGVTFFNGVLLRDFRVVSW